MAGSVVFVGGAAAVGKTSVAFEMYAQLSIDDISHGVIDGDFLDLAHPTPWVVAKVADLKQPRSFAIF